MLRLQKTQILHRHGKKIVIDETKSYLVAIFCIREISLKLVLIDFIFEYFPWNFCLIFLNVDIETARSLHRHCQKTAVIKIISFWLRSFLMVYF